jgi:MoaA/NifB/PqqE/SkfB family radical SAM enzyme
MIAQDQTICSETPAVDSLEHLRGLPQPEPVPSQETFDRIRQEALDFDPARRENYEKFQRAERGEHVDFMPVRMDVENVSRCNFRCSMCQVSDWSKNKRAEDLSFADFKQIIDEQIGLVELKIQGIGEPLMQGDEFFEMIRYARSKALWVRTTTNASLLHIKDGHKKLIDSGVNEVQISIDGATKETFEAIRRGSVFERVRDNCTLINGYCESLGIERTKLWTVVQRANFHELTELVELAAKTKFHQMVFGLSLGDWGQTEWRERNSRESVTDAFSVEIADQLIERGRQLGVDVRFWVQLDKYRTDSGPGSVCPWPFERVYISSDKRIVPCCIIGNPDVIEMGDALKLNEHWNDDNMKAFRRAHLDGEIPEVCKACYAENAK